MKPIMILVIGNKIISYIIPVEDKAHSYKLLSTSFLSLYPDRDECRGDLPPTRHGRQQSRQLSAELDFDKIREFD